MSHLSTSNCLVHKNTMAVISNQSKSQGPQVPKMSQEHRPPTPVRCSNEVGHQENVVCPDEIGKILMNKSQVPVFVYCRTFHSL